MSEFNSKNAYAAYLKYCKTAAISSNPRPICRNCKHHGYTGPLRDNMDFCTRELGYDVVSGLPFATEKQTCHAERSDEDLCGISGRYFQERTGPIVQLFNNCFIPDLHPICDSKNRPFDGHGLHKSGDQDGICLGKTTPELGINMKDGSSHVVDRNDSRQTSALSE